MKIVFDVAIGECGVFILPSETLNKVKFYPGCLYFVDEFLDKSRTGAVPLYFPMTDEEFENEVSLGRS